jgi:hypothetical protein
MSPDLFSDQPPAPLGLSGVPATVWLGPQPVGLNTGTALPPTAAVPAQTATQTPPLLQEPAMGSTNKFPQAMKQQIQKLDRTPTRLDLFDPNNNKQPKSEEVVQGYLGSCSLAATLMALANTASGRTKIVGMIQDMAVTALASTDASKTKYTTDRKLQVTLTPKVSKSVEITDYLYFHGYTTGPIKTTGNLEVIFMHHQLQPTGGVIWPAFIEKAYVVLKSAKPFDSYDIIDPRNLQEVLYDLWGDHTFVHIESQKGTVESGVTSCSSAGCQYGTTTPFDRTWKAENAQFEAKVKALLQNVATQPTVAGTIPQPSDPNLETDPAGQSGHAYAVIGFANNQVELLNPLDQPQTTKPRKPKLSFATFLQDFAQVLQGA